MLHDEGRAQGDEGRQERGRGVRGTVDARVRGRLRRRTEPRPPDGRRGEHVQRAHAGRLPPPPQLRRVHARGPRGDEVDDRGVRGGGGAGRTRPRGDGPLRVACPMRYRKEIRKASDKWRF